MKVCYVRFGEIPKNERSNVYCGDSGKVGEEKGVSVYEGIVREKKINIIMPCFDYGACVSLSGCLNRRCYIVKGKLVGYGSEGEPLLRDIKIVSEVSFNNKKGGVKE